ncbi:2-amino-4-hydroxy-6-hydroxymethyldihydropteridine diphosphokinase [Demequina aurantiaca]|uniref:2-amino-4-hydroxy-6- hydroxymethyldihydropteridine diphosphokinase n=1 Tax=Demequina aurantiaca TaxID=676200 RepID=UPI000780A1B1|nr:2-amino-4-hydroxy-6-hydroxymethyldihydropteridine diphosphokinase [Demequina aurantiaca]
MTLSVTPYVKDGIELDQIMVEGIRVTGYHGVLATERETGQVFMADVVAHVSTRAAAGNDILAYTVNYSDIADRVAEVLAGDPADLLETVAASVARVVLEMEGVQCVDVAIHKPQAPLHVEFRDVVLRIRRDLRNGDLYADRRIGSSANIPNDPLGVPLLADPADQQPESATVAYLALGGNVGDVEPTLRAAVNDLNRIADIDVVGTSPLVRTDPVGGPEQPDFLNAVIEVSTTLSPRGLLAACQGIEMVHGRERGVANGPRTLDIDVISYGDEFFEADDLTVPHPRAHERGFVLIPWAYLAPDATLAGPHGGRIGDLANAVGHDGVDVVTNPWPAADAASSDTPAGP